MFYYYMHGGDWEQVVDNDTSAVMKHDNEIGVFFHKPLQELKAEILFTGSKEDEFTCAMDSDFLKHVWRTGSKDWPWENPYISWGKASRNAFQSKRLLQGKHGILKP